MDERTSAADHARQGLVGAGVEYQRATIVDVAGVAAIIQGTCTTNDQRAAADRGVAGVELGAGECECAAARLGESRGAGRCGAGQGEVGGLGRDINGAGATRTQSKVAVDADARTRVTQGRIVDDQIARCVTGRANATGHATIGQQAHAHSPAVDGSRTGVSVDAAEHEFTASALGQATAAADQACKRRAAVVAAGCHAAAAQGHVATERTATG